MKNRYRKTVQRTYVNYTCMSLCISNSMALISVYVAVLPCNFYYTSISYYLLGYGTRHKRTKWEFDQIFQFCVTLTFTVVIVHPSANELYYNIKCRDATNLFERKRTHFLLSMAHILVCNCPVLISMMP